VPDRNGGWRFLFFRRSGTACTAEQYQPGQQKRCGPSNVHTTSPLFILIAGRAKAGKKQDALYDSFRAISIWLYYNTDHTKLPYP